jgi:mRNA interferase MazF
LAKFIKGEVVVIPFPFSDLTQAKRRPALVLAELEGDDLILCQITSQAIQDNYIIPITDKDFETGSLKKPSNVRPNRIFTPYNPESPSLQTGDEGNFKSKDKQKPRPLGRGYTGFTADTHLVLYRIGNLKIGKLAEVIERVIQIIQQ